MNNESTLLAHLVPRLTSRGEDTATDALAFLLNKSEVCRRALDRLLSDQDVAIGPLTRFKTQVTYEDGSRPDMVGYDSESTVRLVIESKFWAALQERQASAYFDKLATTRSGILLFVAPATRVETLWAEVRRQMEADPEPVPLESVETTDRMRSARVDPNRLLVLVSWDLLLERLAAALPAGSQEAADIQQLSGLVEQQDLDAFMPIQRDELSPSLARRLRWLNHLIDAVVNRGVEDGWMSVKGLKATPQRAGYGRYFRFVDDSGSLISDDFFLCVNFDCWATKCDTPLWLWIGMQTEADFQLRASSCSLAMFENDSRLWTPIYLEVGVEYQGVMDDVVRQMRRIREIVVR